MSLRDMGSVTQSECMDPRAEIYVLIRKIFDDLRDDPSWEKLKHKNRNQLAGFVFGLHEDLLHFKIPIPKTTSEQSGGKGHSTRRLERRLALIPSRKP